MRYCLASRRVDDNGNGWWLRVTDYFPSAEEAEAARMDEVSYLHSWTAGPPLADVVRSDTPRLLDR